MRNTTKTTVYLSPGVRNALKKRVVDAKQTMSQYVDRAVALAIAQDLEDIEAIESRRGGDTETLDNFLKSLKADGLI